MPTLNENIAQVKADFGGIKRELVNKGASIPSGTPTSQYANIIKNMSTGGSEEAYEQGRQDVIAESKYIPKSAVGKFISLNDVSEVSHKVKVVGVGNEVEVYGDNLLPYPYALNTTALYGITINENADRSLNISGTATNTLNLTLCTKANLVGGETYIFDTGSTVGEPLITYEVDGVKKYHSKSSFLWDDSYTFITFGVRYVSGSITNETIYPIVYEDGTKQTITATPLGTEVSSICPSMNFIADEEIKVDYYSSFGMQTEYDRFWDNFQQNGTRTYYAYGFVGGGWNDTTFKPKYDIVPSGSSSIQLIFNTAITDLVALLDERGVIIDTSRVANVNYIIGNNQYMTRAPIFDISSATSANYLCDACTKLESVGFVASEKTVFGTRSFTNCSSLTHCIFSGVIASDINLQWSPLLDEESLQSLTQTLADFILVENNPTGTNIPEGQAFTKTITLSPESWAILDNLEFIPPEGSGYPTGFSCTQIITTAKGWNKA